MSSPGCSKEFVALTFGPWSRHMLMLKQAAEILRYPDEPETWRVDAAEKIALQNERLGTFWDQPWPLKTTFLMLFVAAIVQGWSQTSLNGVNTVWPGKLGLGGSHNVTTSDIGSRSNATTSAGGGGCNPVGLKSTWIFALVNAAPYLAASL
jgi:hypothetical protein